MAREFKGHGQPLLPTVSRLGGLRLRPFCRRDPLRVFLVLVPYFQQRWKAHPVPIADVSTHFVFVRHHYGVEVAPFDANSAQYTSVQIYLEALDNLAA